MCLFIAASIVLFPEDDEEECQDLSASMDALMVYNGFYSNPTCDFLCGISHHQYLSNKGIIK